MHSWYLWREPKLLHRYSCILFIFYILHLLFLTAFLYSIYLGQYILSHTKWFGTIFSVAANQPTTALREKKGQRGFCLVSGVWCLVAVATNYWERKGWLDGGQRGFWEQAAFIPRPQHSSTELCTFCKHLPSLKIAKQCWNTQRAKKELLSSVHNIFHLAFVCGGGFLEL